MGKNINRLRTEAQWTQDEVAERAGELARWALR
jgi:transcriptional regulator with XRE-family HTH domain